MPRAVLLLSLLLPALPCAGGRSSATPLPDLATLAPGELQTVPSFNNCSYYYNPKTNADFRVEYKNENETAWRAAHPPICDQPAKIHKGSLFNLQEDTTYQIRILSAKDARVVEQTTFRTWTSAPPIAKSIPLGTLPENGLVITEHGAPDGWIKYTAAAPLHTDTTAQDAAITLRNAAYIILENITLSGGKRHAILVENSENIRILNCDLSGWGRTGEQQFDNTGARGKYRDPEGNLINLDGAIMIRKSANTVVERCYIHDPRGRSNAWTFSHPAGPEAIVAEYTLGGNVIRWNDLVGSDEHRWNDVIECNSNSNEKGGLYRDSDILGNYMAYGNDDGIELEGGGMNLRFIGNKVEGTLCGISFGPCLIGPQYAIGNLIANPGDESGLALMFLKNSHRLEQHGKRLIYNNTFHGHGRSSSAYGHYGSATPATAALGTMRNNIFVCNESRLPADWARTENFDNDLFWVNRARPSSERFIAAFRKYGQEKNALAADPKLAAPAAGDYRLAPDSPARAKAVEVPGITRAGDDLGAFINGATDIPARPLALSAAPAQINFPATGGSTHVAVKNTGNTPIAFQIRQNNVFDWFTVTPARGTLAPGETIQLTVTADPARLAGRPVFRGAFLVRTPDGLSRPVSVYAKGNYTEQKRPPTAIYFLPTATTFTTEKTRSYALLVRASIKTPWHGKQEFDITLDGKTTTASIEPDYQWNVGTGAERVIWLNALGTLTAGKHRVAIKCVGSDITVTEYIITDKPAVFFVQERNARR